jgi:Transglutaminase-like superfamily
MVALDAVRDTAPPEARVADGLDDMLDAHRRHSVITDPGPHARRLEHLPADPKALMVIVAGIFAHYTRDIEGTDYRLPPERLAEVDDRFVRRMLDRIVAMDPRPIEEGRPLPLRCIGICRDAGVLLCSLMRAVGIPARVRYGLVHEMNDPRRPLVDHVLVEYWCDGEGRWKLCDRLHPVLRDQMPAILDDLTDVPADEFITGGQAWLMAHEGTRMRFRLSGYHLDADRGWWRSRNLFLCDLASLCGCEPQLWDAWGYIRRNVDYAPTGRLQFERLDRLAQLDPRDPAQWAELRRLYRSFHHVRMPNRVLSYSPVSGIRAVSLPAADRRPRPIPDRYRVALEAVQE